MFIYKYIEKLRKKLNKKEEKENINNMYNREKGIFLNISASSLHTFVVLFFQLLILTKDIFFNDCYTLANRRAHYLSVNNKSQTICGIHTTNLFEQRNDDKYNNMNLLHENYWDKSTIYWTLNVSQSELRKPYVYILRREIIKAFKVWSDSITFYTFKEIVAPYTYSHESNGNYKYDKPYIRNKDGVLKQTEIDIFIGVYEYSHGDSYSFDGPGQVLGHAFSPDKYNALGGDIHIDGSDYDENNNIELFYVLVHEIGHSLGLSHNTNVTSVMYNFYSTTAMDYNNPVLPEIDMYSMYKLLNYNTIDKYKFGKDANNTYGYFNETTTSSTTTTPSSTTTSSTTTTAAAEEEKDKFVYKENDYGTFAIKRRACNWPPYFNSNSVLANMEIKDYNLYNTINKNCIRKCDCYSWTSFVVSLDNSLLLLFTNTNGEFYILEKLTNGSKGPYMLKNWTDTKDVIKSGYSDSHKIYLFTVNRYMFVYDRVNFNLIEKRSMNYNVDCLLQIDSIMYMSSNNSYYSFNNSERLKMNEKLSNIENVNNDIILNEYLDLDNIVNWNGKIYGVKNSMYWELELFPNTVNKFRKFNVNHLFGCPIKFVVRRSKNNNRYKSNNVIPNDYNLNSNLTRNRCSINDVELNFNTIAVLFLIYFILYTDCVFKT